MAIRHDEPGANAPDSGIAVAWKRGQMIEVCLSDVVQFLYVAGRNNTAELRSRDDQREWPGLSMPR
jgi:hypothetical protein